MVLFFIQFFTSENFKSISFLSTRIILSTLTSFIISLLLFPQWINFLRHKKIKQHFRKIGPDHSPKEGTPTLGGVIILTTALLSSFLWMKWNNPYFWTLNLCAILFGALGFWDDQKKFTKKNHHGLTAKKKMFFLFIFAFILLSCHLLLQKNFRSELYIPFLKNFSIPLPISILVLFWAFMIVGSSNATNLTDGLDGLLVGPVVSCCLTFLFLSYITGNKTLSNYFNYHSIPQTGEIVIYLSSFLGALLGFLWYNTWPAEIFMGDSGSLAIGAILAYIAIATGHEILYAFLGSIFVIEALSVIIQVFIFKQTGKRVFKMAPLHHHFEQIGWPEQKITIRVWILSIILGLISVISIKIR